MAWLAAGARRPWWQLGMALPRATMLAKYAATGALGAALASFAIFAAAVLTSGGGRRTDVAVVSTFAGARQEGSNEGGHRDGPLDQALFSFPRSIAIDPTGNIYVTSDQNILLRKISASGEVSTIAGPESRGAQSGLFENITVVTTDPAGNVYVGGGRILYKLTPVGSVSVAAGSYRPDPDFDGKAIPACSTEAGETGRLTGSASEVQLHFNVNSLAADADGNVYMVGGDHSVRKLTPQGEVELFAGAAGGGFKDGQGEAARFNTPNSLAVDKQGNLYVSDGCNLAVRKITPAGKVTTLVGNGEAGLVDGPRARARLLGPGRLAVDGAGYVYVIDGRAIRRISPDGYVTTLAGAGSGVSQVPAGHEDGPGYLARFEYPAGIAVGEDGSLYITEWAAHRIRKLSLLPADQVPAAPDGPGLQAIVYEQPSVRVYVVKGAKIPADATCLDLRDVMVPVARWDQIEQKATSCHTGDLFDGIYAYDFRQGKEAVYLEGARLTFFVTSRPEVVEERQDCSLYVSLLFGGTQPPQADSESGSPRTPRLSCLLKAGAALPAGAPAYAWISLPGGRLPDSFSPDAWCAELARYAAGGTGHNPSVPVRCRLR